MAYRSDFDWEGDQHPDIPIEESIIYEVNVRGFTRHHSSESDLAGTYRGFIEKIPYLKELGITAVELLPVFEFDQFDGPFRDPFTGERLANAWGYNTVAFFAPESHYSYYGKLGEQVDEFKMLVRELHKHNIEVILDVVFNHTREGNHYGPTISFKGLDNNIYYMLNAQARVLQRLHRLRQHAQLQPPGRPPVHPRLPAVLGHRDARRRVPVRPGGGLRHRRRPAGEGQDADHPRDRDRPGPVADQADRRAVEHHASTASGRSPTAAGPSGTASSATPCGSSSRGTPASPASSPAGSPARTTCSPPTPESERSPYHSINFVTCHDGFTLNDLVSYNDKHNERNGEGNRDGANDNNSWNCGYEGYVEFSDLPDDQKAAIEALRKQQIKNFLTLLFLSQGTPMLLYGDEMRRTAEGDNNTVFQDNALNWINWENAKRHAEILRFTQLIIAFRKRHRIVRRWRYMTAEEAETPILRNITWHGVKPNQADFSGTLAVHRLGARGVPDPDRADVPIYVASNAFWEPLTVELPESDGRRWYRVVDTSLPEGEDIVPEEEAVLPPRDDLHDPAAVARSSCIAR